MTERAEGVEPRGTGDRPDDGDGEERIGRQPAEAEDVRTLICVTCGTEYYGDPGEEPGRIECGKCGGRFFRPFDTVASEAREDFLDSTERDLDPDDAEGDTLPGDVLDLNRE